MSKDQGIWEWIQREVKAGNIFKAVDGYYVWSPTGPAAGGFLDEYALREMVEYLHAKNAAWDWQIHHDPAIN